MVVLANKTKHCTKCDIEKPLNEFCKDKRNSDGHGGQCQICRNKNSRRWYKNNTERRHNIRNSWRSKNKDKDKEDNKFNHIKRKYGLIKEDYYKLVEMQGGFCPICGITLNFNNGVQIDVDHCHKTGKVRGVLHTQCNMMLGCAYDNIERLKNVTSYLLGINIISDRKYLNKELIKRGRTDKRAIYDKFKDIKRKYGLTKEDYFNLIESQNGLCPLCILPLNSGHLVCVDHDHKSNKVRGIIHSVCNTLLGCADDDINILNNGIEYLQRTGE